MAGPGAAAGSVFGIPGAIVGAGIGATASLFGGKHQADAATKAAQIQADASKSAAQQQAQAAAATLQFEQQQAAQTRADNIAAQQANYGQWGYRQNSIRPLQASGLQANNTLAQLLGLPAQNTQLPDLPPPPNFANAGGPPSTSAPSSTGGSDASSYLKSLLDSGMDPQKASDQTNAKFPGAGALYYAPSDKTSGKAVIGLPDSYLSQEDNGWNVTQRNNGGSVPTNQSVSAVPPMPLGPGQQLSLIPGSLGSIAMG